MIKAKKETKKVMVYLTEEELKQIFDSVDTSTKIGRRDLTILTLLYDTAARASEIINLKMEDIHLEEKRIVLTGKGNKQRIVLYGSECQKLLNEYINKSRLIILDGKRSEYLFVNTSIFKANFSS